MPIEKFLLALCAAASFAMADFPDIDRTDKVSDRRYLDSLNVYNRRAIRVNQSGFRPQDMKYAYVADPKATTFRVIDAKTGKEVSGGGNLNLIDANAIKPNIWVNGAFNSLESIYEFGSNDSVNTATEALYKADFSTLSTQGEYYLVVGSDTSATFYVHPSIYNAIFENSLKFFGIQRCGNTNSQLHAACHLKDGSEIGHDLTGGWHDCGDHFKVSETLSYAAYALATTYLVYQGKAEDRYGNSYDDTVFTDGIPDILYEAKIGADFIYKLYKASKEDGLIAQHDMYHSVAVGSEDHQFWDVPEKQDAQPFSKGGPDRHVAKGVGSISGMFAASLAYFAVGWQIYDATYADSLLEAAKDIYANVLKYNLVTTAQELGGFYPGGSSETNMTDDAAAAALALWYATKDTIYQYDLYKNTEINNNASNYMFNNEPNDAGPYFKAGFLGMISGFYPGGWMTDFENVHAYVLFSFVKLILEDKAVALTYNVGDLECDTLLQRATNSLRRLTDDGSQGSTTVYSNRFGSVTSVPPYNLVWTSSDWGFNRYNMGAANAIFMLSEITSGAEKEAYLNLALDNIYYNLGANPWDISFLMGAGDKNQNHPHNRAANPDGYNAGAMPYKYKCPRGALMGGSAPTKTLLEDWKDYTATETCIDFSVQLLMPAQSLAETLPIDAEGPLYSNIAGTPITDTSAIISWDANEVALTTVFYNTSPSDAGAKHVQQNTASKGGSITIDGLVLGQTYYFYLEGMDTQRNITTDNNHGQWYQFTMVPTATTISGVTICQVDNRSAKIFWWSSDRMNGIVNFGTSSTLGSSQTAEGGAVLFHQATLTNLTAGTTYYFSVSSGTTTDDNGGNFYSFTTEAYSTYADLDIYIKPSAYQDESNCSVANGWQKCSEFIVEIDNNDTIAFEDFEVRLYLGASSGLDAVCYTKQNFDGTGTATTAPEIVFGTPTADGTGAYYLPVTVNGKLYVSGRLIFQVKFTNTTFASFNNGWSLISHTGDDAPEQFNGIDLTQAPYFTGSETSQLEKNSEGVKVIGFTRDPYVPVYYHGKHIYGYGADYTPETGPQVNRTVSLDFSSPFVSPIYSVEKVESATRYTGTSTVSPTGMLDELEMNGNSIFDHTLYDPETRKDSYVFSLDTVLGYGNNYMEWVSWHNRNANKSGSYDCACAIVRSNVEIDTITTPPEERYLVFTVDTIKAYTGKMAEVHVQLFDSLLAPITTERITIQLSSETGLTKFFSESDATVFSGDGFNVDIVNGEAVFYVSADQAMTSLVVATGPNTSTMHYNCKGTTFVVEDLPPWPIIDKAKMIDTDCNGIPDAIDITLSNEYVTTEGQSFSSISFVYGNDTLTSTTLIAQNGKQLIVAANITDTTINTSPTGSVTLNSNTVEGIKSATDFYTDGIAPILTSISVLERLDTATSDRVYFQFSEGIQAPGLTWPVTLFPTDNDVKVINAKIYNDSLNVWEFEIGFDAGGASLVTEGMEAQLTAESGIKDLSGNGLGECTPSKLPVLLKIRPIPMTYASISDADEDGLAEQVNISFSQAIDSKHLADKFSIIFGSATPETLWVAGSALNFNDARTEATILLNPAFAQGNTNGEFEGIVQGKNLVGAGKVIQHLGTGAAYESNEILAEDKAGPVFVTAALQNSTLNTLNLYISEPLQITDSARTLFIRERENLSVNRLNVYRWTLKTTSLNAIDTSSTFAMDGDRVRFAPHELSAFMDNNGNTPATNNPWVVIDGNGAPQIVYDIHLRDNLSKVNTAIGSATASDPTMRLYVMNQVTHKLDAIDAKTGIVVQSNIDTTVTPLTGALWVIDLTVPRGAAYNEEAAWNLLRVKYEIPIYTNLGSFVNRISGTYNVSSAQYLSSSNKVTLFVEWTNAAGIGVRDQNGRAAGTGAYIYKAELETKFVPNTEKEAKTQERFSVGSSYDQTKVFGIKRYSEAK